MYTQAICGIVSDAQFKGILVPSLSQTVTHTHSQVTYKPVITTSQMDV